MDDTPDLPALAKASLLVVGEGILFGDDGRWPRVAAQFPKWRVPLPVPRSGRTGGLTPPP